MDYISEVLRTANINKDASSSRVSENIDLLHAAIGMATESGEFIDAVKKHVFYGKPLDVENLREELGDQMWYIALACKYLDVSIEEIQEQNISKLKKRYPDSFSEEHAKLRLDKEYGQI